MAICAGGFILFDRKAAFWITTTLLVCLFAIFILLAVFITPKMDLDEVDPTLVPVLESMGQMVWWMTVGLVMMPVMLLIMALSVYFLFTSNNEVGPNKGAIVGPNFLDTKDAKESRELKEFKDPKATAKAVFTPGNKVADVVNPSDALDLRYARGEITRDKYLEMQRDLKKVKL